MVILLTLKSFIFLNDPSNSINVEVEASCQHRLKSHALQDMAFRRDVIV